MTPPREVAHFVKQSGRHVNSRGLGHAWSLVIRGVERLWTMILYVADLPETPSNIVLCASSSSGELLRVSRGRVSTRDLPANQCFQPTR